MSARFQAGTGTISWPWRLAASNRSSQQFIFILYAQLRCTQSAIVERIGLLPVCVNLTVRLALSWGDMQSISSEIPGLAASLTSFVTKLYKHSPRRGTKPGSQLRFVKRQTSFRCTLCQTSRLVVLSHGFETIQLLSSSTSTYQHRTNLVFCGSRGHMLLVNICCQGDVALRAEGPANTGQLYRWGLCLGYTEYFGGVGKDRVHDHETLIKRRSMSSISFEFDPEQCAARASIFRAPTS